MSPTVHLIQASVSTAILYPFIGDKAFIVGGSIVAIDIDHFIEYYRDTGKLDIKGFFKHHEILLHNLDNYLGINLFHTVECYIILFLATPYFPDAAWILSGFLFHHLFDQIQLIKMRKPFARAFSVVEYFIRKQKGNYYTSINEVLAGIKERERQKERNING